MKRCFVTAILLASSYLAVLFFLGSTGARCHFSPDSLEHRAQREILLFGKEIPLFRASYEYHQHELTAFLIAQEYWTPQKTTSPRWIPVFHWNEMWKDGYSSLHIMLFRKQDEWIEWTKKNPKQASTFWPDVLQVLRSGDAAAAAELLYKQSYSEAKSSG